MVEGRLMAESRGNQRGKASVHNARFTMSTLRVAVRHGDRAGNDMPHTRSYGWSSRCAGNTWSNRGPARISRTTTALRRWAACTVRTMDGRTRSFFFVSRSIDLQRLGMSRPRMLSVNARKVRLEHADCVRYPFWTSTERTRRVIHQRGHYCVLCTM